MAGLVLNLKPYEKFLVGGVVVQNGQRRTQLRVVGEEAGVLRLTDALHPDEVSTPLTRAYFIAQQIITGDAPESEAAPLVASLLDDAVRGFDGFTFVDGIQRARAHVDAGAFYKVLKGLRPLLAKERAVLMGVNAGGNER